ncbi:zinc finger HIT domain-containing protein 3 isoform X6 [Arabidopsis lyrata subsp. lyrata]|uniref:zinc finger HIT domain-containing protein 3 isoform X6 n=1 Tax=Arabidopsis lyrata subsp. lyrata TaxID=81972 RepID=UPI000A29DD7B|nr:zinc finger HIT domain-containing protein 3 isoform X6 [Arabidopsis lyrata subsp. lyrata]|eukprot:XP_020873902.1 zinc finger HIT domain-containing protein 3 isoform X6 [Arabidopsis lyrata subsp. lyrata]
MCPRAAPTCDICKKLVSKYKCPSCLVPYCSLGCFKIHKETPCAKPSGPSSTVDKPASPAKEVSVERPEEANDVVEKTQHKASAESPAKEIPVARPIHVEEEKYVLEKTHFEAIASSSEIREALKDEALQKLIYRIDSSSNPLQELDGAMGIEAFREFTDKILSNISKSSDEQFLATTCLAEAQL